jgi:hypothetical protein
MIMPAFYRAVETGASPDRGNRNSHDTNCPPDPRIVETRAKTEGIILGLTRPVPTLSFMRGRQTPAVETTTPNEETRR